MITFNNLKIEKLSLVKEEIEKIRLLLIKKLESIGVLVSIKTNNDSLILDYVGLFKSKNTNKILMNHDDPRVKSLGRDYLDSHRLTLKQYNDTLEILLKTLPKMGVSSLVLFKKEEKDPIELVNNLKVTNNIPKLHKHLD